MNGESKTHRILEGSGSSDDSLGPVQLVVIQGRSGPLAVAVGRDDVRIGRLKEDNEMVLASGKVSKRHARVFLDGGRYHIEDLKSTNKTWVNETQLEPHRPRLLCHGDTIQVGDHVLLFLQTSTVAEREDLSAIAIDRAKVSEEADRILDDCPALPGRD